jgi:hypothetical protein
MATIPVSPEELKRRKDTIEDLLRAGYRPTGWKHARKGAGPSAVEEASRRLKLNSGTLTNSIKEGRLLIDWSVYAPTEAKPIVTTLPSDAAVAPEAPELPRGVDREAADARHAALQASLSAPVKRYLITSAQNATGIYHPFFETLKLYAKAHKAEIVVIPYRYRNPTSRYTKDLDHDDWWSAELVPYIVDKRFDINEHLTVLADIKTQPTASRPLSGFESITGERSAIVGHPKLELTTVATPSSRMAKILTTTGACTERNYLPAKAGRKAEFHHCFGATVVEVVGKRFHLRQINAKEDGSFIDLDREYRAGAAIKHVRAEAVVLGDVHADVLDPAVEKATFDGPGSIVGLLRPKHVVYHDVLDFGSRNHHDAKKPFVNYAKFHAGRDNVRDEVERTCAFIDRHSAPDRLNVLVPSNHVDALARWVEETDPRADPRNAVFWARTFEHMCVNSVMTERGASVPCPFNFWAEQLLASADRTVFLKRDDSFVVAGIELGLHGDAGSNGARGSRHGISKIGVKTIIGHSHSPGIQDGCYQVGTSSRLRLAYNRGPSSWLNCHAVVYTNGKRSLIFIVDGEWRA